jgi:hypothetical protein
MIAMNASSIFITVLFLVAFVEAAQAQTVRLYCKNPHPANNTIVEVDYASRTVTWWSTMAEGNRLGPASARITQYEIAWNGVGTARGISYRIDRISGESTSCDRDGCWPKSVCEAAEHVKPKF